MQIGFNQFYARSATLMQQLTAQADTLNTQISTQTRLQTASDDVVGYQRLAGIRQATSNDVAAAGNVDLASAILAQGDTALTAVGSELQRATELVVQAGDGTLTEAARQNIATQLQGIVDDLVGLANSRDARGQPLFGAATGDTGVTVAADGSVSFAGAGEPAAIPIGDAGTVQANDSAARVFGGVRKADGSTSDVFAILGAIVSALKAGDPLPANASDDVSAAIDSVSTAQGSLGARAARLDLVADQFKAQATQHETDRSAIEDTDTTEAFTQLQKTMTVLQATQASFTKLSELSLFNYLK